jgi:hypothetical protein
MKMAALHVTLALVFAPTSASAECAWPLWTTYKANSTQHAIERAFETQVACEGAVHDAVQLNLRVFGGVYDSVTQSPADPAVVIARGMPDSPRKRTEGDSLIIRVSCWPLGLQPRGVSGRAEYPSGSSR